MRRTLTELAHIAAALAGTAVFASLAAWSVPRATGTIWEVAFVAMGVMVVMGIRPLRAAWRADRVGPRR